MDNTDTLNRVSVNLTRCNSETKLLTLKQPVSSLITNVNFNKYLATDLTYLILLSKSLS